MLVLIGCKKDEEEQVIGSIIQPPSEELKAEYLNVKNTETPDYAQYQQAWEKVNKKDEVVKLYLDEMSFKEAFDIQYRAKGEGHMFWWRGQQYTTDILKEGE